VHPALEGQGLERIIAVRLLEIARRYEADSSMPDVQEVWLKAYTRDEVTPIIAMWEDLGLRAVRQYWIMERDLSEPIAPAKTVEGVLLRNYRRPEDNSAAKADNVRPDLSWLAEVGDGSGNIAGVCINAIWDEENKLRGVQEGWIELLGTTREWRGKGLGRALLLSGLHSLKSAGMDTALLGVDSESLTGANRLYESVGFSIRSREVQQECLLNEVRG
jgi:ribosomal protein S18 acetylase RimI-like enzyme